MPAPASAYPQAPADALPGQPAPQPGASLLERVWQAAVKHSHSGASTADLDAGVRYYTNGRLKSFQELAVARMRAQSISSQQEQARIQTPGRALTYAAEGANALAAGIPEKLAS